MRHRLHVCALAAAVLASSAPAFAQADERIIYASVVDRNGAPVLNLTEKDFVVREDGQAREILRVTKDTDPLQIALLIDNSRAMRNQIADLRRATAAFVDNIREGVQIALITLGERPTIAVPYTTDRDALKASINRLFATSDSGNYLLDGIAETSEGFEKRTMWRRHYRRGRYQLPPIPGHAEAAPGVGRRAPRPDARHGGWRGGPGVRGGQRDR